MTGVSFKSRLRLRLGHPIRTLFLPYATLRPAMSTGFIAGEHNPNPTHWTGTLWLAADKLVLTAHNWFIYRTRPRVSWPREEWICPRTGAEIMRVVSLTSDGDGTAITDADTHVLRKLGINPTGDTLGVEWHQCLFEVRIT